MPNIGKLFPQSRSAWAVWFLLMMILLPIYYFWMPYPGLNAEYERERWIECERRPEICVRDGQDPEGNRVLGARMPRYVADFIEMPLEISVKNISNDYVDAVVVLQADAIGTNVSRQRPRVHFLLDGVEQDSVIFRSIPAGGTVTESFMVRVSGGQTGDSYKVDINFEGASVELVYFTLTFDRKQVLKLWALRYLLLPPNSNVALPIGMLILVTVGETGYMLWPDMCGRLNNKGKIGEWVSALTMPVLAIIAAIIVAIVLTPTIAVVAALIISVSFAVGVLMAVLKERVAKTSNDVDLKIEAQSSKTIVTIKGKIGQ